MRKRALVAIVAGTVAAFTALVAFAACSSFQSGASNNSPDAAVEASACPAVDTTSDTHNCGACNHDCLGGTCSSSKCVPVLLVSMDGGQPFALAMDDTSLYFSDTSGADIDGGGPGTIYSVNKLGPAGSQPSAILQTTDPLIYDLAADATGLYFSSGSVSFSAGKGTLETALADGGSRRVIVKGATIPRGVSIDADFVYWASTSSADPTKNAIDFASKGTGGALGPLAVAQNDAIFTVSDGQNLFWTNEVADAGAVEHCSLGQASEGAPEVRTFCDASTVVAAGMQNLPEPLALSPQSVFYGTFAALYQISIGTADSQPVLVADNQGQPAGIVADRTDLYWINEGTLNNSFKDGDVRHCPIDQTTFAAACVSGGDVLAKSSSSPRAIVMDAKAVYWTEQYNGSVFRLAR